MTDEYLLSILRGKPGDKSTCIVSRAFARAAADRIESLRAQNATLLEVLFEVARLWPSVKDAPADVVLARCEAISASVATVLYQIHEETAGRTESADSGSSPPPTTSSVAGITAVTGGERPASQFTREWIQCSERVPDDGQQVLVFWRGAPGTDTYGVARFEAGDPNAEDELYRRADDRWSEPESGEHWGTPTHWMPLPEPPVEPVAEGEDIAK